LNVVFKKSYLGKNYEVRLNKQNFRKDGVDVWISKDSKLVYIYIFGGTGGVDCYFAKIIISEGKGIKRIIVDYFTLSNFGTYRPNFIGF